MARIAIIVGNPRRETFSHALAEAYRSGAAAAGHQASVFSISDMQFDPILREGFAKPQPLEPDLQAAQDAIGRADHLVIVFPLWFGTLPALLKGFIERVFQPGFAITGSIKAGTYRALLQGQRARVIITMGMPGLIYRWYYGAHCAKMLRRNILEFVGFRPVRTTIYGMVESVSNDTRAGWLREVETLGRQAA
jgi:putative NADPH-quinone reductase